MAEEASGGLCIGDLVTLQNGRYGSFLGAEGIIKSDVTCNEGGEFADNLFQVHLQRQYSAARELEQFVVNYRIGENHGSLDEATKQYLQALENGRNNEVALNNVYLENSAGKPVVFGDVVQLYHVKSKKYICVNPKELATNERENSLVYLSENGNLYAWFRLMPRFKIDREGDRINSGSEVYVTLEQRASEYLHAADVTPRQNFQREINASLISSSFKLEIFQSMLDAKQSTLALFSQLVYIFDPETRSNLAIGAESMEQLISDEKDEQGAKEVPISLTSPSTSPRSQTPIKPVKDDGTEASGGGEGQEGEGGEEEQGEKSHFHDYGDIVIEPIADGIPDSRTLWLIEAENPLKGGLILWRSVKARFRHLSTGLYMCMEAKDSSEEMSAENCIITTTTDMNHDGTLFSFFESNGGKYLRNSKALSINHNGIWLERGKNAGDTVMYEVKGTRSRTTAMSLVVNPFDLQPKIPRDDAVSAPLDEHVALSGRGYVKSYLEMTVIPSSNSISTLWPTAMRTDLPFFHRLIESLVYFSQGFPISREKVVLGADAFDSVLRAQRQRLLRELDAIEQVLRLIHKLIPMSDKAEAMKNKRLKFSDEEHAIVRMANTLLDRCFFFIYYCVLDCPENQMFVADNIKVLLSHLSTQQLAGRCVTEMLSKNMELQETKIGESEISIFVDKLRTSNMNSMYLNLLQSCCSCEDDGVDNNQCLVAELLFEDTTDIIIEMHADFSKIVPTEWASNSLYIPSEPVPGSPVLGDVLLNKGLPQLSLAWTTNSIDCSPLGLFGKLSVNISELYGLGGARTEKKHKAEDALKEKSSAVLKLEEKKNASETQKAAVADYFINEMFLGAEMCMDRNYVAMHKLDPYFTFESLVAILKMDVQNSLKAGAARLLLCQHIDRDPQAETKIPILTRIWTDVQRHQSPQLPFVDPSRYYIYGLVQQLISEHVRHMAGRKWDTYSKYVLDLLLAMIKFNFYGTIERMHDVIEPLIQACDRRKITYSGGAKKVVTSGGEDELDASKQEKGVEEELEEKTPWQKTLLDILDSNTFLIFIICLTIAAVAVTIVQVLGDRPDDINDPLYAFNLAVFICFVLDYTIRFYCSFWLGKDLIEFVTNGFNMIDALVISIDIIFFGLPPGTGGSEGHIIKTLRLIRLLRLLKLIKAASSVRAAYGKKKEKGIEWVLPLRYTKVPQSEIDTLTRGQEILIFVQSVIQDRNLSLILRHFRDWERGDDTRSPPEIFEQVIIDSSELTLGVSDFDLIFIDMLMISNAPLNQGALDVLMSHHSARLNLLEHAKQVQILVAPKRERQFKIVDQMLKQLEQNAETHELWGELQSDTDHMTNKQTQDIIVELVEICRIRRTRLEFDEEFEADPSIQDLFRNLGCFSICFKMLGLLDSVEEDENGELGEVATSTRKLCKLTNELLYWFCLGNERNQELCYSELSFFLESLDAEINSHRLVRAIFKNNERLMNLVPHSLLYSAADDISKCGKFHGYLSLPVSITHVGEKNFTKNQFEIMKAFAAPGKLESVSCFLTSPGKPDYKEKLKQMAEVGNKYVDFDEIPQELAYHLTFLEMLSNCTVGRINITSVEAKVQSIYDFEEVLECILDPNTIVLAKTRLAMHLYNSVVEVELSVPLFDKNPQVWNLLYTFPEVFTEMHENLKLIAKNGWLGQHYVRQKIEYAIACLKIVHGFFGRYYDPNTMPDEKDLQAAAASSSSLSKVGAGITAAKANALIALMWDAALKVYEFRSPNLTDVHKTVIADALEALNKSATVHFVIEIDRELINDVVEERNETSKDEVREVEVHAKWSEFLQALVEDSALQRKITNESRAFIKHLEEMPFLADKVESDLRYEVLIQKLVRHITNSITIVNGEKRIDTEYTKTAIWIIKSFRTMIENKMGMNIYERDAEGGDEQDELAADTVKALNGNGATTLCIDLIATGIDAELQVEAIQLIVGMLFKEGGAKEVQTCVHDYLAAGKSDLFFRQVRATITKLIQDHKWKQAFTMEEDDDPEAVMRKEFPATIIVRFLQLLCEGHYGDNQDIMRDQPTNLLQTNLLDDLVLYLNTLSRLQCRVSTTCAIRVAATILEVIQGPCVGNQTHFALNTDLLEVMNRVMRLKPALDCDPNDEIELKKVIVDIFEGLLEGQQPGSVVSDRVLSVIHIDIIQVTAMPQETEEEQPEGTDELATECLVLLQILKDLDPEMMKELGRADEGMTLDITQDSTTTSVEVSWTSSAVGNGVLNRRFFHIPEVCSLLAKSSKDRFVMEVDRSNNENKLIDFLHKARSLYKEAKHQQQLVELELASVFSTVNKDRATWITFILAWVQNALFVAYYNVRDSDDGSPQLPPDIQNAALALNIVQMFFAAFTVVLTLVVRTPVVSQCLKADHPDWSPLKLTIFTALDPMTIYYIVYLILSVLGSAVDSYFISLLLLDIVVKNSTAASVLMAIYKPIKQLGYSGLLGLFLFYIFGYYLFRYYQQDQPYTSNYPGIMLCDNLYNCVKFVINFGLQNGGGPADQMLVDVGTRLWYDLAFYIIIPVIWLNITAGIVIDTFSGLRSQKNIRDHDTTEFCFICGISKQEFDRKSDKPEGFKTHIREDHNMWSYLNFIFFIFEQDKDDDDGLEYYVRDLVEKNQITWFPLNRAMRLDKADSEQEELAKKLHSSVETTQGKLVGKLGEMQTDIGGMLEGLVESLKEAQTYQKDEHGALVGEEEDQEWYPALGYNVFMSVVEILEVDLPEEDLGLLNLRVISDSGMYSISGTGADLARKACTFSPEEYLVAENAQPTDKSNLVSFQILQGSSAGTSKFVGVVEIPISEALTTDSGAVADKSFMRMGQIEPCTLRVVYSYEQSKRFTKGAYDDDQED